METKTRIALSFVVLIALIVGGLLVTKAIEKYTTPTGNAILDGNFDNFVDCLASKNVKMYGADWCGHCQNQKKAFGESEAYMIKELYVECDPREENPQTDLCISKGITGYPTWEIDGKFYPGEMSLDKLAELAGCKLS